MGAASTLSHSGHLPASQSQALGEFERTFFWQRTLAPIRSGLHSPVDDHANPGGPQLQVGDRAVAEASTRPNAPTSQEAFGSVPPDEARASELKGLFQGFRRVPVQHDHGAVEPRKPRGSFAALTFLESWGPKRAPPHGTILGLAVQEGLESVQKGPQPKADPKPQDPWAHPSLALQLAVVCSCFRQRKDDVLQQFLGAAVSDFLNETVQNETGSLHSDQHAQNSARPLACGPLGNCCMSTIKTLN